VDSFIIGVQVFLAGVFAFAGVAKLLDLEGSRRAMVDFGVPERIAPATGLLLPLAELATAVLLVMHPTARAGGIAAFALLLAFCAGIANAMVRGKAPDCNCFGQVHSAPVGPWTLVRNGVFAGLATVLVIHGPGPALNDWLDARSTAELVAIAAGMIALGVAVYAYDLWSQKRTLQRHLDEHHAAENGEPERLLTGEPEGLPVGTAAPDFTLSDLGGEPQTLRSLRERGHPVVLEFVDPTCSACDRLLPALSRWQSALADHITVAVVTPSRPQMESIWGEHGISNVLLDETEEVTVAFNLRGTPSAVAVDVDGTVAAAPAGGAHMPEVLIRMLIERQGTDTGVDPSVSSAAASASS
jgi:thiol-disulfide isomerase/thioredoxin